MKLVNVGQQNYQLGGYHFTKAKTLQVYTLQHLNVNRQELWKSKTARFPQGLSEDCLVWHPKDMPLTFGLILPFQKTFLNTKENILKERKEKWKWEGNFLERRYSLGVGGRRRVMLWMQSKYFIYRYVTIKESFWKTYRMKDSHLKEKAKIRSQQCSWKWYQKTKYLYKYL